MTLTRDQMVRIANECDTRIDVAKIVLTKNDGPVVVAFVADDGSNLDTFVVSTAGGISR